MPDSVVLLVGSLVPLFAVALAFAADRVQPSDVVGTPIGTDLMLDAGFGDAGSTIANFNDADGTWDEPVRVAAAADGGSWVLGFHRPASFGDDGFAIVKLRADGTPDPAYGSNGQALAAAGVTYINDAAISDDSRFYVAGMNQATPSDDITFGIGCVETDATPCAGFGDGGSVSIALADAGFSSGATRILVRGDVLYAIGNTDPGGGNFGHSSAIAVAKLDAATGALDTTFGADSSGKSVFDPNLYPGGMDYANDAAFAVDSNGHPVVLVAGSAQTTDNQSSAAYVLAFDPDTGALDADFGDAGIVYLPINVGAHLDQVSATAIAARADGRIFVAGNANHDDADFNITNDVLLAALNADGTLDDDFAGGGLAHVNIGFNTDTTALALRANGDLVLSMQSNGLLPDEYDPFNLQSVVEFDANGGGPISTVSLQFESDPEQSPLGRPKSVMVDANDRVVVAGLRLWGYPNYPAPDFDITATRLVRDAIFAGGFEAQ